MPYLNDFYVNIEESFTRMRSSDSWRSTYILLSYLQVGFGMPIAGEFRDTASRETARVRINIREEEVAPITRIRQLYDIVKELGEEEVLRILGRHVKGGNAIQSIRELGFLDLRRLAATVLWLTSVLGLRVSNIDLLEDPETGQPQFIGVYLEDCNWDKWKTLSRAVKKQLVNDGFNDVARRVALICTQALKTRRS